METLFTKYEVSGNNLILTDMRHRHFEDIPSLAITMCTHHTGIGADGLLSLHHGPNGWPLMRMFNPDGTEDFCGNGVLCTMAYLCERGEDRAGTIEMLSSQGRHEGRARPASGGRHMVRAEILKPRFDPQEVPVALPGDRILSIPLEVAGKVVAVSCVNVGTTHTVILSEHDVPEGMFREVSPLLEHHDAFPKRTSVLWCRREARDRLWIRIWERGVGETFACGTGACAALAIAATTGRSDRKATVASRGGEVVVDWPRGRALRISTHVHRVYNGSYLPA